MIFILKQINLTSLEDLEKIERFEKSSELNLYVNTSNMIQ